MKLHYRSMCLLMLAASLTGCAAQESSTVQESSIVQESSTTGTASSTENRGDATYEGKSNSSIESEGFEEPEEALIAYLMGMKEMDLEKMVGSFAVETFVRNIDFQKYIERYGAYSLSQDIPYPGTNPLQESINIENRRSSIVRTITNQYVILGYSDFEEEPYIQPGVPYPVNGENPSTEFLKNFGDFLDGIEPESITILGFIPPEKLSDIYNNGNNQAQLDKRNSVYGSDKIESHVIVFEIHGDKWMMCADTVNYGGKWYIMELKGNIGQLMGIPVELSGTVPILDENSKWEEALVPLK